MIKLKDGSEVQDNRLTRLVQFDERSRNYSVREIFQKAQPRTKVWQCNGHLNQGNEGSCVGFSMAHELRARPVPIKAGRSLARRIYFQAQKRDEWPGGAYPGASPFYEGTSILAGIKILKRMGYIEEYRWAFGLEDLILAVGYLGPVILGINWYESMFSTLGCNYVHVFGNVAGGHAILCKGVNVKHRWFRLHNSWGTKWGFQGDAFVTWNEMERLLHEQGEAVIPLKRKKPKK